MSSETQLCFHLELFYGWRIISTHKIKWHMRKKKNFQNNQIWACMVFTAQDTAEVVVLSCQLQAHRCFRVRWGSWSLAFAEVKLRQSASELCKDHHVSARFIARTVSLYAEPSRFTYDCAVVVSARVWVARSFLAALQLWKWVIGEKRPKQYFSWCVNFCGYVFCQYIFPMMIRCR